MKQFIAFVLLFFWIYANSYAISKEDFLKTAFDERRRYAVIDCTYSSEYAIPREEYSKLSNETLLAIDLEIAQKQFLYARDNVGKKYKELEVSRLFNLGDIAVGYAKDPGILYPEQVIDYAQLGGKHRNHFEGAKYYYKHYLEWKKHEQGKPSLWSHPGADAHFLSTFVFFYDRYKLYKEWSALYADYNEFHWKPQAASYCKQFPHIKDCVNTWLNRNPDYQDFLAEWKAIKKLAKTTKPTPLSPQVQNHEWFYSEKQEEVLKALEYYHVNNVRFMLEKALEHKDPAIAAKAREYLDNPVKAKETSGDETKK